MTYTAGRRPSRLLWPLVVLLASWASVLAQNENETVGFSSSHVFESGSFGENIDVLNGGLNLTIPIGQRFQLNSRLGYGLTLNYNSKVWDTGYWKSAWTPDSHDVVPYNEGPMGLGFGMHFGRIFRTQDYIADCDSGIHHTPCLTSIWQWVSPDGTHHEFWSDDNRKFREFPEPGVIIPEGGASGTTLPTFVRRQTYDLGYTLISGPKDAYCYGAAPPGGCFRVETPDGLIRTLAKRVDCVVPEAPPDSTTPIYQRTRSDNQSFCGWYTVLVEDPSVGSRTFEEGTGRWLEPYPHHVKIAYDTRPGFEHAIASVSDSAGRTMTSRNCEWARNYCSGATTQSCNVDGQCPEGETCIPMGRCTVTTSQSCRTHDDCPMSQGCVFDSTNPDLEDRCVPGSRDTDGGSWTASDRSAVATYSVEMLAFGGQSDALDTSKKAIYKFVYEFAKVKVADLDYDGQLMSDPVLKLVRLDYPDYVRPSFEAQRYSIFFGYVNPFTQTETTFGGAGDYGELTCRTLPLVREIDAAPQITANPCTGADSVAKIRYSYVYYTYIASYISGGGIHRSKACRSEPIGQCGSSPSGGDLTTGLTRQIAEKRLELPGTGSIQPWKYERVIGPLTNPLKVTVTDPFGNDTVYFYHASSNSTDPAISGRAPDDGYAPEWDDGLNYRIEYHRGRAGVGVLMRAETQEFDSDEDPAFPGRRSKSNIRARRSVARHVDNGGVERIVTREDWDNRGHWRLETQSGFSLERPRITRQVHEIRQSGPGLEPSFYMSDLLAIEEVGDGTRVVRRTENQYDSVGRLLTSIARAVPPAALGDPLPAGDLSTTNRPGDLMTTYSYSTAGGAAISGNVLRKTLSTGRAGDPEYAIRYTYAPALGTCAVPGECGGYLASKTFEGADFNSIERLRDANTGLILATRDTAGVETRYAYDVLGRVTEIAPAGEEVTKIDYESLAQTVVTQGTRAASDLDAGADFLLTRYLYDGMGRLVVTQKRPADPSSGAYACQKTQYDLAGNAVYRTEWKYQPGDTCVPLPVPPQSQCWAHAVDLGQDPGTEYDYRVIGTNICDPFGRVQLEIPSDAVRGPAQRWKWEKVIRTHYFGNSEEVTVNGVQGDGAVFPSKTTYIRDALDRLIIVDAPTGKRCSISGNLCSSASNCPVGESCEATDGGADAFYTYDAADRLLQVELTDNLSLLQVRRFAYDGIGQRLWAEQPESGTTVYLAYDPLGSPLSIQDAKGTVHGFTYDAAGRLREQHLTPRETGVGRMVARNTYDEAGRGASGGKLTTIQSYSDEGTLLLTEQRYFQDNVAGGRLSQIVHTMADWGGTTELTNYSYNARGQVSAIRYPLEPAASRSALTVDYVYRNGYVVSALESGIGTVLGNLAYNPAGAVSSVITPGGRTTITHDERNRPKRITGGVQNPQTLEWSYDSGLYLYDGAGNISRIGDNLYGYDAANRLVAARTVFSSPALTETYDERFAYDVFGNLADRWLQVDGGTSEHDAFVFGSPNTNRIVERRTTFDTDPPAAAVGFSYDANGNLVEGGRRWVLPGTSTAVERIHRFEYDPSNRVLKTHEVTTASEGARTAEIARYAYDAGGNRVWKLETGAGLKTYYLRDAAGQVLTEFRRVAAATGAGEWIKDYVYLAGRLLSMKENLRPEPPAGLALSQQSQGSIWKVTVTWEQNTEPDTSGYTVYRKREGVDADFVPLVSVPTPQYEDETDYASGVALQYRVVAVDTAQYQSLPSASRRMVTGDTSPPSAPDVYSITAGDQKVTLEWHPSSDQSGIAGYEVWRRMDGQVSAPLTAGLVTGASFVDVNLVNGQTYYYKVRAIDTVGNWSGFRCKPFLKPCQHQEYSAVPKDFAPPVPPRGVTVGTLCGVPGTPEKLSIGWDPNPDSDQVASYELYKSTDPIFDTSEPLATLLSTTYEDVAVVPGTTYYYAVKAVDGMTPANESELSETRAGRTRNHLNVPQVPLYARARDGMVRLSWEHQANYRVYRKRNSLENCGSYLYVGETTSLATSFTDGAVPNNAAYDYAVTVTGADGVESSFSRPALAIPLARPSSVTQCEIGSDPWDKDPENLERPVVVQWSPPAAQFYQPLLATNTDGTYAYLKGYRLYHHRRCGGPNPSTLTFQDDSPLRVVVPRSWDLIDPYLIDQATLGATLYNHYVYADPRYTLSEGTLLSSADVDSTVIAKDEAHYACGSCSGGIGCFGGQIVDSNCAMPKAVYKVFAEGAWLTVESDWPEYFDPLETSPSLRCGNTLRHPDYGRCSLSMLSCVPANGCPNFITELGDEVPQTCVPSLGRCGLESWVQGANAADPNFVPPPRKILADAAGPGSVSISWVPPTILSGRSRIAGYYIYGRASSSDDKRTFYRPLPLATVGPDETSLTISGLARTALGYVFAVATVDELGRVSGEGGSYYCDDTGTACPSLGCTMKVCNISARRCSTDSDCSSDSGDYCRAESCTRGIGRWCSVNETVECVDSLECPGYYNGKCSTTRSTSCDPTLPNQPQCPSGEACIPGERCRTQINHATAGPGSEPTWPRPPASLRTVIWTVNDLVAGRGRAGVRIAWIENFASGDGSSLGFRVYRSTTPDGPYCALLDPLPDGGGLTTPLPPGVELCTSDRPGSEVEADAYSSEYSTGPTDYNYWDRTVASGRVYYYRVSQVRDNGAGPAETPFSATYQVSGRELPYEANHLPPPQGFRAGAPKYPSTAPVGLTVDERFIYLRWCPTCAPRHSGAPSNPPCESVASDLPTVKEYRIYRTRLAEFSTPRYRLYARLDPACLDPGVRCVVDAGKTCVDPTSWVPNHEDPALACPIISPEPCDDSNGPRCAIVDAIFAEWPALTDPVQNQYYYNYRYFVTAVGVWCPEDGGPCVETESMPSPENQGWLNYRKAQIDGSYTWLDRRDPDGDGQFMVCGDENVHFYPDLIDVDASDASIAVSLVAPHRTLGQPVPGDGGGDGGSGGGNPYNPPARFVYYHLDHLGSPRVVVDGNGVVQARHHFLPFGEERPAPYEQTLNNRAFTGHERDGDTGLDYMLARYYSSSLARFMAVDPGDSVEEEDPQSWNRYSYTKNNPLKYNDPDGESPTLVTAAAGFGVGALIRGGWELGKQVHAGNGVDWQKVGAKALSGGIEGAVAGATAGLGLISFMGANTAATVGAGILERGIDGDSSTGAPLDAGEMGEDLAAGAIGSLGGKLFQGVATGDWKTVEIGTRGLGEWEKASAQSAVKTGMSATKTAVTTGAQAMGGKKQPASKVDQKIQAMKERAKQGPAKKQK